MSSTCQVKRWDQKGHGVPVFSLELEKLHWILVAFSDTRLGTTKNKHNKNILTCYNRKPISVY